MLEAYRKHVAERAEQGIVPKPLSAEQVACFVSKSASSVKLRTQVPVLGLRATNTAFSDFGSSFLNAEIGE